MTVANSGSGDLDANAAAEAEKSVETDVVTEETHPSVASSTALDGYPLITHTRRHGRDGPSPKTAFAPGDIVIDRKQSDPVETPAVVVGRPPVPIGKWYRGERSGTVADVNPDCDPEGHIVVVVYATDLVDHHPDFGGHPTALADISARMYSYPAERLEHPGARVFDPYPMQIPGAVHDDGHEQDDHEQGDESGIDKPSAALWSLAERVAEIAKTDLAVELTAATERTPAAVEVATKLAAEPVRVHADGTVAGTGPLADRLEELAAEEGVGQ